MPGLGGLFGNRGGMPASPRTPLAAMMGRGPFVFGGQQYAPTPQDIMPGSLHNLGPTMVPGMQPGQKPPVKPVPRYSIPGLQPGSGLFNRGASGGGGGARQEYRVSQDAVKPK